MPDNSSKYKRTNLFLLRVWCDDIDPGKNEDEQGDIDERPGPMWHGRVQRTVSGEAHTFENKEALIKLLESMLYKGRPQYQQNRVEHREDGNNEEE